MRVKLAALTIAIALLMLLPSSAKADTFDYNVTANNGVDVTFDLPTFQETVTNVTTFVTNTSNFGPFTAVSLSGNSSYPLFRPLLARAL